MFQPDSLIHVLVDKQQRNYIRHWRYQSQDQLSEHLQHVSQVYEKIGIFHLSQDVTVRYMDMCGTATVLGAMKALTENNVKTNVIGVCCLADNAIDGDAYYPSDIVKSYKVRRSSSVRADSSRLAF